MSEYAYDGDYETFPTKIKKRREQKESHIRTDEVKNLVAKKGIEYFNKLIGLYVQELNNLLPDDAKLDTKNFVFDILCKYDSEGDFKPDGNTRCEGNSYSIIWAYKIKNIEIEKFGFEFKEGYVRQGWVPCLLTFHLEFQERLFDGKCHTKWFQVYVTKPDLQEGDNHPAERVFYINNNYSDSIASKRSTVQTIKLLKENAELSKLYFEVTDKMSMNIYDDSSRNQHFEY